MFRPILSFLLAFLFLGFQSQSQQNAVLLMDAKKLTSLKKTIKTDKKTQELFKTLIAESDKYLEVKPPTVMDKAFTPESGSKHDYMSQAPYFWYDSTKANGLPYIRKDGERNPEILKITDRKNIGDLEKMATALSVTYFLTGNEKYANKAAKLLSVWFLEEATKMNPNLDYAQAIPGVNSGRGIGIIETIALTGIADASSLLQGSKAWTNDNQKSLKDWYGKYLNWMLTSKNGIEEQKAENNHGTFYDMQVVYFALFTGKKDIALKTLKGSKERLEIQIDNEGKMPLELERTQSLWYSTYNLEGWVKLAKLADKAGVDLWNYTNKKQGTIIKALDWLAPFALNKKPWPYQQIEEYKKENIFILFKEAARKFNNSKYSSFAEQLNIKLKDPVAALIYSN